VVVDAGRVQVGDKTFDVAVGDAGAAPATVPAAVPTEAPAAAAADSGDTVAVESHMPGKVVRVVAEPGTVVADGDAVVVIEAMKMEVPVPSPVRGTVVSVSVATGEQVAGAQVLATVRPD
jgi:biotin carboxyl carrier protein